MTAEDQKSGHNSKRSSSDTPTIEVHPPEVKRLKRKGKQVSSSQDDIQSVTNFIDTLTTNNCKIHLERLQLEKQKFEFWKEKEAKKQAPKERKQAETEVLNLSH